MEDKEKKASAQKTGFWQRAALRAAIVLAGVGVGQKAAAQNQSDFPQENNIETTTTPAEEKLTREDVAEFKQMAADAKAELQENIVDFAQEIVEASTEYTKPSRKNYTSQMEYEEDMDDWKKGRRQPSAKDFETRAEYQEAVQDWKEEKKDRIGEKIGFLGILKLQEMQMKAGKMEVGIHEMMADMAENTVDFSEKTANMDPSSKEYKKALKAYQKEMKNEKSVKRLKRMARSAKEPESVSENLQKMGQYMRDEKALDAAIAKGVKANKKILDAALRAKTRNGSR